MILYICVCKSIYGRHIFVHVAMSTCYVRPGCCLTGPATWCRTSKRFIFDTTCCSFKMFCLGFLAGQSSVLIWLVVEPAQTVKNRNAQVNQPFGNRIGKISAKCLKAPSSDYSLQHGYTPTRCLCEALESSTNGQLGPWSVSVLQHWDGHCAMRSCYDDRRINQVSSSTGIFQPWWFTTMVDF